MTAERMLTLEKRFAATPAQIWAALSDPDILPLWWGPDGFSCQTKEIDLRAGGQWRFDMIAPDGTIFANRHRYHLYEPLQHIAYILDDDGAGMPAIAAEITLIPLESGTLLTLRMTFGTEAARREAEAYHAVEMGYQTLGKLAAYLGA